MWPFSTQRRQVNQHAELVVAALLPGRNFPLRRRVRSFLARGLSWMGVSTDLAWHDPCPLITAPVEASALFEGGPGSGKTHGWATAQVATRAASIIQIDVQKGAGAHDIPLRRAMGRTVIVFDPDLAMEPDPERASGSVNVLADLDPTSAGFAREIAEKTQLLLPEDVQGENESLRKRARSLIEVILANLVVDAAMIGQEPVLVAVREALVGSDLPERLQYWAEHGHLGYRNQAMEFLADQVDPELIRSVQFFASEATRWLDDWWIAALVCGWTAKRVDPADLVGDRGKVDWVLQPSANEMKFRAAAWRLILDSAIQPHIRRTPSECWGLPKTMLLIDEAPTLGRFELIREVIFQHRQKGLMLLLFYQNRQQIDEIYGAGTIESFEGAVDVRGYTRIDERHAADLEHAFGETLVHVHSRQTASGGGPGGGVKSWEVAPLVSRTRISNMAKGEGLIIVQHERGRVAFFGRLPLWFEHPGLQARVERARADFAPKPAPTNDGGGDDAAALLLLPAPSAASGSSSPSAAASALSCKGLPIDLV